MVDGSVPDAPIMHIADDGLKRLRILAGIAVKFHVGDVSRIGQGMVGRLNVNLAEGPDGKVDGHMEGVGVVLPVRHAGDGAVTGAIQLDKTP